MPRRPQPYFPTQLDPWAALGMRQRRCLRTNSHALPDQREAPRVPSNFSGTTFSYHWDTTPPTPSQLSHASKYFKLNPPTFLWSASKFKKMDFGSSPEVCFLGRSNVGKSSLLNAILCKRIAHTSSNPGRTKTMNAFAVGGPEDEGKPRLVVLDMPGYGKGGAQEWGVQVLKYLGKRRQLKRVFLLINAEHGLKKNDSQMLAFLKEIQVPHQIILSKVDKVLKLKARGRESEVVVPGQSLSDLTNVVDGVKHAAESNEDELYRLGEIIVCSSEGWVNGRRIGIDAVRYAMLQAAEMELPHRPVLAKPAEIVPYDEIFR